MKAETCNMYLLGKSIPFEINEIFDYISWKYWYILTLCKGIDQSTIFYMHTTKEVQLVCYFEQSVVFTTGVSALRLISILWCVDQHFFLRIIITLIISYAQF